MFDAFQFGDKISKVLKRNVWLDCGGNLVIESFEAMTVIDVNSGKMISGRNAEDNALRVNLEAANEVARQIRLRDIGGMIVVDFIDMKSEEDKQDVLNTLTQELRKDPVKAALVDMTKLNLAEVTRKKVKKSLREQLGNYDYHRN